MCHVYTCMFCAVHLKCRIQSAAVLAVLPLPWVGGSSTVLCLVVAAGWQTRLHEALAFCYRLELSESSDQGESWC